MVQINLKNEIDFCPKCPQTSNKKHTVILSELYSGSLTGICSNCGYSKIVDKSFILSLLSDKFDTKKEEDEWFIKDREALGKSKFEDLYMGDWNIKEDEKD